MNFKGGNDLNHKIFMYFCRNEINDANMFVDKIHY